MKTKIFLTCLFVFINLKSFSQQLGGCQWYFVWLNYTCPGLDSIIQGPSTDSLFISGNDSVLLDASWDGWECGGIAYGVWYRNNIIIDTTYYTLNGEHEYYLAQQTGTYKAKLYQNSGTGLFTYLRIIVITYTNNATSVSENFLQNILTLHPNPVHDNLDISISVHKQSNLNYDIFDMTGKSLRTFSQNNFIGEFKQSENFESLASGIYFFQLTLDGERIVKKVVKQ